LNELLLYRFPYRMIPRLPPAKLMANIVRATSDFIDDRRKSLVRWLTIVSSHPLLREDGMIRVFLTDGHADQATWIRDQYRHFPDEFIISNMGNKARDMATPGLRTEVMESKAQMTNLSEILGKLAGVTGRLVTRRGDEQGDMVELARELGSLNANSVFSSGSSLDKNSIYDVSKEISGFSTVLSNSQKQLDTLVNQRVLMLGDMVFAFMDMIDRHDKGLLKEHKVATEKMGMIKCRDLRGALATDIEMRDFLEKNINENEIVLTDLESRQAFALLCMHSEGKVLVQFVSSFVNILKCLSDVESKLNGQQMEIWNIIHQLL